MSFTISFDPAVEVLVERFKSFTKRAQNEYGALPRRYSEELQKQVIKNASGRPGPRRVTGGYVASVKIREDSTKNFRYETTWSVFTNHPAARRLELGYYGRDAAGRVYNQRPYPHWRPAIARVSKDYIRESRGLVRRWWNG